jgi:ABC-2 type transport system ATP-binding protein
VNQAAIRTDGLSRNFGAVKAVNGLTLEVPQGTVFGFLGPNGSGKTTTINLLLGLIAPTSGGADVLGFDVGTQADEVREHCGALLDYTGLYEQLSAEANLEFYARVWRMPEADRRERIKQLLTHIGFWDRRGERVGHWSRGMRQKLAIARALVHRPSLVFMDEPTAGLDVMAANAVRDDLASLAADEGVTVFLTTHNMTEAERLCSQVAVIREGRLIAVGAPDELRARTGRPRLEVIGRGFTDTILDRIKGDEAVANASLHNGHLTIDLHKQVDTAGIVRQLVEAGAEIEEVRKGQASLEEAFVALLEDER